MSNKRTRKKEMKSSAFFVCVCGWIWLRNWKKNMDILFGSFCVKYKMAIFFKYLICTTQPMLITTDSGTKLNIQGVTEYQLATKTWEKFTFHKFCHTPKIQIGLWKFLHYLSKHFDFFLVKMVYLIENIEPPHQTINMMFKTNWQANIFPWHFKITFTHLRTHVIFKDENIRLTKWTIWNVIRNLNDKHKHSSR